MRRTLLLLALVGPLAVLAAAHADETDDLLKKVRALVDRGKIKEAFGLLDKAVKNNPKNIKALFFRGALNETQGKHREAIADYDQVLALSPKSADVYNSRGSEHLKMGHIKRAIADFDKVIQLNPKAKNGHWKRGIALYYAGRYKDGRKQFAGYEAVDTNDVENTFWHFLCVARSDGLAKARKAILKTGKDQRVPMMMVYALIQGKAKPADVLAAARKVAPKARPGLLREQLFYAHLYLGLYYEVTGDKKKSLEHMTKAAKDYYVGMYMGDITRMHLKLRKKEAEKK
jgi:lipoprotein NlpI